jgi:hypothetical protein
MLLMDGTLDQLSSHIDATMYGSGTHDMNEFLTPLHGSPPKSQCHLHRPQTLSWLVSKTSSRHYKIQQQTLHWHHAQIARWLQAIQNLTSLLTGIIKQDNHGAPSLRVDAPAALNETASTKQSSIMKTSADNPAPALRVEFKEQLTEPTVPPHQVQADEPATYENSTGAKGRHRRKQAQSQEGQKYATNSINTHAWNQSKCKKTPTRSTANSQHSHAPN